MRQPIWRYYEAPGGGQTAAREIAKELGGDVRLVAKLAGLQDRITSGETLPRDCTPLGDGLVEARLSVQRNEWRLFYAVREDGLVLLALCFAAKKSQTIPRMIKQARKRLAEWDRRV
ncbi:type II toxin-antitoxin system RelE/ParE family toxin [Actinokineospora sp. NBRC 105648]|uniref:type II toxin-antitoxin system RelE/ParE family toxin n=1 Tax=Actinokineospora sp. NBRC 105648 TaxID=3032206 RepID=UPI0025528362|nr:type II toxin-antitoxin system RelE/ParE family toxin [Actinokineospora sp. NBRC 105648]